MKFLSYILFLYFSCHGFAQERIQQYASLESKRMGQEMSYSLYLPPDYDPELSYPVIYLLHGYWDDGAMWLEVGGVDRIADSLINNKHIDPVILVMPDGELFWYMDSLDGKIQFESYFFEEFIPFIESRYSIDEDKRSIAGMSMGGHGSLLYALKYPEMFRSVTAMSPAVYSPEMIVTGYQEDWDFYWSELFGAGLKGRKRLTDHLKKNNVFFLIDKMEDGIPFELTISIGKDDMLLDNFAELKKALDTKRLSYESSIDEGAHTWDYWTDKLPELLLNTQTN